MGTKNGRKSIWYFDQSIRTWLAAMNFPFPSCGVLPGCSLIDVDGELYVSGGMFRTDFHRYDPEINEWEILPGMEHPKMQHRMVWLNGFIYTLACDGFMERYNMEEKCWEERCLLPEVDSEVEEHSVVAFKGKLIAAEVETDSIMSSTKVYDPIADRWYVQEESCESFQTGTRTLTVQDGKCYQVIHTRTDGNFLTCQVNPLHCSFDDDDAETLVVTVGDAIDQSPIPKNHCGAFCINGRVFVKLYGYIHRTDVTVHDGHLEMWSLRLWNDITHLTSGAAITNFTFDRHRLHPAYTST